MSPSYKTVMVIFVAILSQSSSQVFAAVRHPSFDCAKASAAVERLICDYDSLAEADAQLAALYAGVRNRLDQKRRLSLIAGQRNWVKLRDEACLAKESAYDLVQSADCLQGVYDERINELRQQSERLDFETSAGPTAGQPDLEAILDAKRDLGEYQPDMSFMRRYVGGEQAGKGRLPETCRELYVLSAAGWDFGGDRIGTNSATFADTSCLFDQLVIQNQPFRPDPKQDAAFDDFANYSLEFGYLSGMGEKTGLEEGVETFGQQRAVGKLKMEQGQRLFQQEYHEFLFDGRNYCFDGWQYIVENFLLGDFTHRGRREALIRLHYSIDQRLQGIMVLIAYYDPATKVIRPQIIGGGNELFLSPSQEDR